MPDRARSDAGQQEAPTRHRTTDWAIDVGPVPSKRPQEGETPSPVTPVLFGRGHTQAMSEACACCRRPWAVVRSLGRVPAAGPRRDGVPCADCQPHAGFALRSDQEHLRLWQRRSTHTEEDIMKWLVPWARGSRNSSKRYATGPYGRLIASSTWTSSRRPGRRQSDPSALARRPGVRCRRFG